MRDITYISSESSVGWGNIYIAFGDKVNMDIARFEVATIIRNHYESLPPGVSYYPNAYQGGNNANVAKAKTGWCMPYCPSLGYTTLGLMPPYKRI